MKFSFVLALAVVFNVAFTANAQQAKAVEVTPCTNETASRPTLKRRQTNPDNQPAAGQKDVAVLSAAPCDNAVVESNSVTVQDPLTIQFEGLAAVEESEIRKHFRERRILQSLDSARDSSIVDAQTAIKNLLGDYGHRHAEVSSRFDLSGNGSPVLTFVISEGPPFTISEIRFIGNRVFSEQLLAAKIKESLATFDKEGRNVYRSEVFEYCIRLLTNYERSQGYLKATFAKPQITEVGEGLRITIRSDEGVLYRFGSLEIEGAHHVAEQDIRKMLDMRGGDIANGEKIAKTLYEDLKAIYGEKGFIQYTAEIQPGFRTAMDNSEGVVDFKVTIDEGRRFKISKISFKGDNLPESDLRELLLLRDGDVYNQKLFEQSVSRINETGWFNRVDKDKDVDYRTNEEEGLVSLVIMVTRQRHARS